MKERRTYRAAAMVITAATALILGTGVAQAALTADILLTTDEAKAAAGYSGTLTAQDMPSAASGLLMRMWMGGQAEDAEDEMADPNASTDMFTVMVIDPTGTADAKTDSKAEAEKAQRQAQQANPGLECKVVENKGTKVSIVCWSNAPGEVMVMDISTDLKVYTQRKKVNGKFRNVPFKKIPVIATAQRQFGEGKTSVTQQDKDKVFAEGRGLRNAQMAKLPAQYS